MFNLINKQQNLQGFWSKSAIGRGELRQKYVLIPIALGHLDFAGYKHVCPTIKDRLRLR